MEKIENLMSESINKLNLLLCKEHLMKCNNCGLEFDMRNLDEVIKHESCINLN